MEAFEMLCHHFLKTEINTININVTWGNEEILLWLNPFCDTKYLSMNEFSRCLLLCWSKSKSICIKTKCFIINKKQFLKESHTIIFANYSSRNFYKYIIIYKNTINKCYNILVFINVALIKKKNNGIHYWLFCGFGSFIIKFLSLKLLLMCFILVSFIFFTFILNDKI